MKMRVLAPELLDSLPPGDPAAVASRRDLRLLNGVMGNFRWLRRQLTHCQDDSGCLVEIGAGDGTLARKLCAAAPALTGSYHALDLAPRPALWPDGATWHQADLWSPAGAALLSRATAVVANLVLHHFDDDALRRLGGLLPQCRRLLACEPVRRTRHLWQGRLLFPVLHPVTRHDLTASIRAGFRGAELAAALGLDAARWQCSASGTFFGAYRLAAIRKL